MVYNVTIFGIKLKLNPIAFTLPIGSGWNIYWYGIIIAVGFLCAVIYAMNKCKKLGINQDKLLDAVIITTPISVICARLYYIIFDPNSEGIKNFFNFNSGGFSGLAIYGAVIGAVICVVVFSKLFKFDMFRLFDLVTVCFLLAQGIGRWGNFMNQEAFGMPTGSKWFGMTSEAVVSDFYEKGYDTGALAHPCFLYESIACIAGFFVLNYILTKKSNFSGQTALLYGVWYGTLRAIVEPLRTDSLMAGSQKVSFILSIAIAVACLVALIVISARKKAVAGDTDYVPMFSEIAENEEPAEALPETEDESKKEENIIKTEQEDEE